MGLFGFLFHREQGKKNAEAKHNLAKELKGRGLASNKEVSASKKEVDKYKNTKYIGGTHKKHYDAERKKKGDK